MARHSAQLSDTETRPDRPGGQCRLARAGDGRDDLIGRRGSGGDGQRSRPRPRHRARPVYGRRHVQRLLRRPGPRWSSTATSPCSRCPISPLARNCARSCFRRSCSWTSQAMTRTPRHIRKLLLIDEAWSMLKGGSMGEFVETYARTCRKYGGALATATQSLNDYYKSGGATAALENSDWMLILQQKAETIADFRRAQRLDMDDRTEDVDPQPEAARAATIRRSSSRGQRPRRSAGWYSTITRRRCSRAHRRLSPRSTLKSPAATNLPTRSSGSPSRAPTDHHPSTEGHFMPTETTHPFDDLLPPPRRRNAPPGHGARRFASDVCYIALKAAGFIGSIHLMALGLPIVFFLANLARQRRDFLRASREPRRSPSSTRRQRGSRPLRTSCGFGLVGITTLIAIYRLPRFLREVEDTLRREKP